MRHSLLLSISSIVGLGLYSSNLNAETYGNLPKDPSLAAVFYMNLLVPEAEGPCDVEEVDYVSGGNFQFAVTCGDVKRIIIQWDEKFAHFGTDSREPPLSSDPLTVLVKDPGCYRRMGHRLESLVTALSEQKTTCFLNPLAVPYPIDPSGPGYHERQFICGFGQGSQKYNVTVVLDSNNQCSLTSLY